MNKTTIEETIELNNQLIKQHDDEVFKNTKEINWLARKNVNRLESRNRLVNEVEKLEKELESNRQKTIEELKRLYKYAHLLYNGLEQMEDGSISESDPYAVVTDAIELLGGEKIDMDE